MFNEHLDHIVLTDSAHVCYITICSTVNRYACQWLSSLDLKAFTDGSALRSQVTSSSGLLLGD